MAAGKHVADGEGRTLAVLGGDVMTFKATGADTDGRMTVFVTTTPPGAGPPPHMHTREDEFFFILEGSFEFNLGGRRVAVGPGDSVYAPRDVPHVFKNVGSTTGKLVITCVPAGIENFFEEFAKLPHDAPPDPKVLADFTARFGIHFLHAAP